MTNSVNDTLPSQQEVAPPSPTMIKPSLESSLPSKSAAAEFYGYGDCSPGTSAPLSLNKLISERKFARVQMNVASSIDYGYGEAFPEPPNKRRRFQRRNSKTPAMLRMMHLQRNPLFSLDFLDKIDTKCTVDEEKKPKKETEDDFAAGLELAEELVMHLRNRRRNSSSASSALLKEK